MPRLAQTGVLIVSMAIANSESAAAATHEVLTTARELLSLTAAEAANNISVSVTGVVTVAEPNWGGKFIVQDSTGGVFVDTTTQPQPALGDLVQVTGVSNPGGYAPDIISPYWKKLGAAPLPEAKPVSAEQLMSGAEDGLRVELTGVVRSARRSLIVKSRFVVELASGGYRFRAFPALSTNLDPNSLVGATVHLRGTDTASYLAPLRQILTVVMFVPHERDFVVERYPDTAISQEPFTPLGGIAQYRRNGSWESRIRVKGVVMYQRPGEDIFLHDKTGGLQVECGDTNTYAPCEIVEAVGFPGLEHFLPVLEDATLIRTKESGERIVPRKVSISELLIGSGHADLISLQGKLLDYSTGPVRTPDSPSNSLGESVLTLKSGDYFFTVEAPAAAQFAGLASIPIGSTLEVSGICLLQASEDGKIKSVQVLLADAASISILQRPSWWTAKRLLTGLIGLLAVSLVGITWTIMILRKNSTLKLSIAEKIKAQDELQKANELLESRVQERTRELKFQMNAREAAEVQVKATLAERTRIAQELHDTLLQGFTGIGLKLDALTTGLPASLAETKAQLQKILEQSDEYLVEARRSVWELRSPSLETSGEFSKALKKVSERALQGSGIQLSFSSSGSAREPSRLVEDNLLRICEEAVTNAVKHAHPSQVEVHLEFTSQELRLRIWDNGCGFDPQGPECSKPGHFGLVGIQERVKALSGKLSLISQPGKGAEIIVTV